jgi:hypothetical protein
MKCIGRVDIPQKAFLVVLNVGESSEKSYRSEAG